MYINFWYPICTSEELDADKPQQTQVLGLRFVAFRDAEGKPHVLSDTCVHRGGSLSKGKVVDGCVVCPYHGWRYAGDGKCQLVPSLEAGAKPPARAKVDSYPVQEKYGIVFAFLGDLPEEERSPLYVIEEYEDPAWRASEIMILEIDCFYQRSMENGVDPVHNEFVHPIQGSPQPIPGTIKYPETPWGSGVLGNYTELGKKLSDEEGMRSDPTVLNAGTWHHGPNTLITWITFAKNTALHQYMFEAPVDGDHTKIYFINMRSFRLGSEHDESIREANLRVTVEDITILENLYPVRTPETRTKEILTPADKAVVRYRDFLQAWNARGWRLDSKEMRENDGDVAYAIPSPERRSAGNWVLDPVPLMPAAGNSIDSVDSAA
jgi:phenylpropionate dioxygenase-like ring-hydroxylating dioxygenase large terminal subunit